MPAPAFRPGFRISTSDGGVLLLGAVAMVALWPMSPQISLHIGFVIAHFFLFFAAQRLGKSLDLTTLHENEQLFRIASVAKQATGTRVFRLFE